jgi:glycosyltransferase involved in cell wall biosynthesis
MNGRKLGGVEVFVDRLGNALAKAGFDVEVITLTEAPENIDYRHRQIFKSLPFLYKTRIGLMFILPLLLPLIGFGKYDIIHFHGSDWGYVFRTTASIRTFHGSAFLEAKYATNLKRKITQYLAYPLEHLSRRLSDVSLGVGVEACGLLKTDGVAKLFAPGNQFYPGTKTVTPSFIFIGTWGGRKRGRYVADSFTRFIAPYYPQARLFMACDYVPASEFIIDLENPSAEHLAKVIRESWALLSASTYEGFGIPYLEALMSGTAVITTRNAGADYVLEDGNYGLIVAESDFSNKIVEMIESPEIRKIFEEKGIFRAKAFSQETVISEHLAYYRQAIQLFHKKHHGRRKLWQ